MICGFGEMRRASSLSGVVEHEFVHSLKSFYQINLMSSGPLKEFSGLRNVCHFAFVFFVAHPEIN